MHAYITVHTFVLYAYMDVVAHMHCVYVCVTVCMYKYVCRCACECVYACICVSVCACMCVSESVYNITYQCQAS